jgi:hypothetical protein
MIIVVSGLPRSGTSMTMRMLEKAGIETLTDEIREPDQDNPKGYYEYQPVKDLERDSQWLKTAEGKAVKIVSPLLRNLPPEHTYKVLFMERNLDEVLASQRKMMERRGERDTTPENEMKAIYLIHLQNMKNWLQTQANIQTLYIDYNQVIQNPEAWAHKIQKFLNLEDAAQEMASVVDPKLYRQRT